MADPVVKNIAYTANEGKKVIEAFEEFSSSSVAMSPNQWDPRIRLPPPTVQDNGMDRLYSSEFKGHSQGVGYGDGGSRPNEHQLDDALKSGVHFRLSKIDFFIRFFFCGNTEIIDNRSSNTEVCCHVEVSEINLNDKSCIKRFNNK